MPKKYELIIECTDSYQVEELPDGSCKIHIVVPKRFSALVTHKLMELKTDDEEISSYESLSE